MTALFFRSANKPLHPGYRPFWTCLASVCAFITLAMFSSHASIGAIRVTHTGARFAWGYEEVDFVVTRRGTLVIECDSYGNSVQVSRSGELMFVTELNPGGASYNFSYTIRDAGRLTDGIRFKGGAGPDVYLNETTIADEVYGNGSSDSLTCGFGYTYVSGGPGDDVIYLRTSSNPGRYNQAFGDAGGDTIYGSEFSDYIFGGVNGDYLEGSGGDDYMLGGTGGDILFGNAGNDRIGGGFDGVADLLSGGEGSDEYSLYAYPGTSVNLDGSLYDIEPEAIVDDGTDRRRIIRQSSPTRSIEESFLVDQDYYNAYLMELTIDAYGYDYLFDPLAINPFDLEPIVAQSADDPRFLLPSISPLPTSTTTIKKNNLIRVGGW